MTDHRIHPRHNANQRASYPTNAQPVAAPPADLPPPGTPGVQYVYVQTPPREWSGAAIASFIFSVLWLFGIGSLLGLIFGIAGARECVKGEKRGEGLATCGWILGLLGLVATALILFSGGSSSSYSTPTYTPYYGGSSYSGGYYGSY